MSDSIPEHWGRRNLSSLGEYRNGFAFNELHWSEHGLPIVRIAQITGSQEIVDRFAGRLPTTFRIDDGDLIFSWSGTLAVVRWDGGPAWLNQHLFKVIPAADIDSALLFHLLRASVSEMNKRTHGSTMKHIKRGELDEFFVSVPVAAQEQKRLAQVLDTLDTAIHETEAIIAKLKAVKQGLLHDLLTRGIDANGELRPPQAEAPHLYKQSPLGWIPKAWKEASAQSLCSLITKGTTPAASKMWQGSGDVRFLRVDNLSFDGKLDFHASNFFVSSTTHRGELARSVCQSGDVMTNIVGPPLGKLGLVTEEAGEVNINQAIALFRPKPLVLSSFLLLWVGSSLAQTWFRGRAKQTSGQVNLTLVLCQELPVPEVPMEEQQWICVRLTSLDERLSLEINELGKLTQKKSGLMDDLLTGRVRVTPLLAPIPA